MKVATIILAIAVASVSAKNPTPDPVNTNQEPAVRANLREARDNAVDSALHTTQAVADAFREANTHAIRPAEQVVEGGLAGAGHKTAGFVDSAIGNFWGTTSFLNKKVGQGLESGTEFFHNLANKHSKKYDYWHDVKSNHDEAAAKRFDESRQPLKAGVENVKSVATSARDKTVELKDEAAQKLHETKVSAEEKAESAKDATVEGTRATGNRAKGAFSNLKSKIGHGVQKTGEVIEEAGAVTANKGEEIRQRNAEKRDAEYARSEEQYQNAHLHVEAVEEKSSAATLTTMSGAAIAIASAAAVYLF